MSNGQHRLYWIVFTVLAAVNLAILALSPTLPSLDAPMHLAYVRILADYHNPSLPFRDLYEIVPSYQPYFVSYKFMAALAPVAGVIGAFKIYLALYALLLQWGAARLADAIGGSPRNWAGLSGAVFVWNPVLFLGFLTMLMAMALVLHGLAFLVKSGRDPGDRRSCYGTALCAVLLISAHLPTAGFFVLFCFAYAAAARSRELLKTAAAATGAAALTHAIWGLFADTGMSKPLAPAGLAYAHGKGLTVIDEVFGFDWGGPVAKAHAVLWTVLGPWRLEGFLFALPVAAVAAFLLWKLRGSEDDAGGTAPAAFRWLMYLALIGLVIPAGIRRPADIAFIDTRYFALLTGVALCAIPARYLASGIQKAAFAGAAFLLLAHTGWQVHASDRDIRPMLGLLERHRPDGVVSVLSYRHETPGITQELPITVFAPMYYTALDGGTLSLFWGGQFANMPVRWKPGRQPAGPDTLGWTRKFHDSDLRNSDWVLFQKADPEGPRTKIEEAASIAARIAPYTESVDCSADWCLYRILKDRLPAAPRPRGEDFQ